MSILGERFFKLSNALFYYHLTPIQFTVYSFLVSSAGQKRNCWPSMKTIAANCGCSQNAADVAPHDGGRSPQGMRSKKLTSLMMVTISLGAGRLTVKDCFIGDATWR